MNDIQRECIKQLHRNGGMVMAQSVKILIEQKSSSLNNLFFKFLYEKIKMSALLPQNAIVFKISNIIMLDEMLFISCSMYWAIYTLAGGTKLPFFGTSEFCLTAICRAYRAN